MNRVAEILYAVAVSVLLGTGLAIRGGGFTPDFAAIGLGGGMLVGVVAWWRGRRDGHKLKRPRGWGWVPVVLYAMFAFRAFLWLIWRQGDQLLVLSPNNIGDMSLHLTFIEYFKSGAPFWPESPILAGGKLSYAAGMDIFNAMLGSIGVDTVHGLVCVGLVGAILTGLALWRWGGAFTLMGFLCIGGLIGLAAFAQAGEPFFQDYAGNLKYDWAWKNPALAMLVTQRGFLFALPAGLLLLSSWRSRFFSAGDGWRLPFLGELLLYASMPLFHMHTFLALSFMLAAFFVCCAAARWRVVGLVALALVPATVLVWFTTGMRQANPEQMREDMSELEKPQMREQPRVLGWQAGWMAGESPDAEKAMEVWKKITRGAVPNLDPHGTFLVFWLGNFGLWPFVAGGLAWMLLRMMARRSLPAKWAWWGVLGFVVAAPLIGGWPINLVPLALATVVFLALLYFLARRWEGALWPAAFVFPALYLFFLCCHVKFAPWSWDNTKIMIWCVLIVMPFLWEMMIIRWTWELRTAACVLLFFTGWVSLLGGLAGRDEAIRDFEHLQQAVQELAIHAETGRNASRQAMVSRHADQLNEAAALLTDRALQASAPGLPDIGKLLRDGAAESRAGERAFREQRLVEGGEKAGVAAARLRLAAERIEEARQVLAASQDPRLLALAYHARRGEGYEVVRLSRLEWMKLAVREIPRPETIACAPVYNHPLLLIGRKVVLGYEGHLGSHGLNYGDHQHRLESLMNGEDSWRIDAAMLGVRYLWWGPEEEREWPYSRQSWRKAVQTVHSSAAGELFDLELPRVPVEEEGE